jgi:hypothetical protein
VQLGTVIIKRIILRDLEHLKGNVGSETTYDSFSIKRKKYNPQQIDSISLRDHNTPKPYIREYYTT